MHRLSVCLVAALVWSTSVSALPWFSFFGGEKRNEVHITFDCQPPSHKDKLPIFSLGETVKFPEDKLQDILKSAAPGTKITQQPDGDNVYFYDGSRLVGYFDRQSGETAVLPKLGALQPGNIRLNKDILSILAKDRSVIPNDDTKYSIVIGSRLGGSKQKSGEPATAPATYLLEGIIKRQVDYERQAQPVCGPGSKGTFSFGADGAIKSMSHRWRAAKGNAGSVMPLSQGDIQKQIEAQLTAANLTSGVRVKGIELCFYDSGAKYIQPVYRFNATITNPFGLSDEVIVGYVPAGGKEQEPLPTLNPPRDIAMPTPAGNHIRIARRQGSATQFRDQIAQREGGITVGRYAMRGDQYSPQMVVDENAFWNGLSAANPGRFVNSQYYWDEPFIYEDPNAPYFIDAVNIAFTEGHGNVHQFATDETLDNWGPITIPDNLPSNGLGPGAGGSLVYWIIRACDTISTPLEYSAADFHKAFDPWWPVFNGLHAVMGYRTEAQVYDNEMGNVGTMLGRGASVVHGWMSAALGGGKTSAVTVCGHDDDTVYQTENIGRPGCLQIWWYS
jgi:Family of unknown function (DUF6345)